MNSTQQTARVGLFFLLGLALVWVAFETLSGNNHFFRKQGYHLVASFADLKEVKVGDEVRMAGVKIGSVERTQLANRRAQAVLRIDPKVKVPNDATASIMLQGLLGTDFIGIDLGTEGAPPLADGAEIRTMETPDLNTIMTQLGDLGKSLNGTLGTLSTALTGNGPNSEGLLQKLDRLVGENSDKVNATLSNLRDITDKLNRGQGTLGRLINDPALHDQLLTAIGQINSAATDARQFMANARSVMDDVKHGQGPLGMMIYDQTAAANLKATVQNLKDVSDKLAKGEGTLGKLLMDDSLYTGAQTTLKKADRALDNLNDSGPITAVGVIANSLF